MDYNLSDVPNFILYKNWYKKLKDFFAEKGYSIRAEEYNKKLVKKGKPYVVVGISPRGNFGHAVVYKDFKPYHDPHPSNEFLDSSPLQIYIIKLNVKK
jgi:hypothetical protein